MVKIYDKNTYCKLCEARRPFGIIYCPECGNRVRHRPRAYRNKQEYTGALR